MTPTPPRGKRSAIGGPKSTKTRHAKDADLNQYDVTTHFNGQSAVTLDGDTAAGECYTIAHHLYTADGERKIMIASLRYLDTYSKVDGAWYFAERKLIVDWMETRTSIAP